MARIKKKGTAGQAKNYITRTQAVRKLQISLPDFRKLCIWKGIYPREPRNRKKVSKKATHSTTFYYTKDIQYLLHEPLLQKFREHKTLEKKISRALGRGDFGDAKRLETNAARPQETGKPRYTLDHVIRERYPTFVDALRDLDDCLSMLFLFANLPSTSSVPAKMIARCERLCLEFEHYLIASHSLRKSFLSIKGIYYQATIQGQDILWLVPYRFNQRVTADVDFRIMGTFVEFYQTLLGFVNFRLYTALGLVYPPKFDAKKDSEGAELGAFTLSGAGLAALEGPEQPEAEPAVATAPGLQQAIDKFVSGLDEPESKPETVDEKTERDDEIDKFEPAAPGGDVLLQPSYSATDPAKLFANFTFYLSRETPRQSLEFLLRAFGCKRVGWDTVLGDGAYTHNENDPSITHQIVDRPPIQPVAAEDESETEEDNQTAQRLASSRRIPGRIYVQPQWVWDCINDEEVKRPDLYAPGAALPPHLSPFVKKVEGQYDPSAPLAEQDGEEELADEEEADDIVEANGEVGEGEDEEEGEEEDEEGEEEDEVDEDEEDVAIAADMDVELGNDESDAESAQGSFGGFSEAEEDSEDEATSAALQRQKEIEAEFTGATPEARKPPVNQKKKAAQKQQKEKEEELERAKMMMSRKKRKLLEKMVYSNKKKDAENEKLRTKRRKLEKEGKRAA